MKPKKTIIIGAAGRDFHNFNTVFRDDPSYDVLAFTATQIPEIDERKYPAPLAGPYYPDGIPIHPMEELEDLIRRMEADLCIFSYSDIRYVDLMHVCNRVVSAGADFKILAPQRGFLKSSKPLISVVAVRTGCGKSQTTRRLVKILKDDLGVEKVVAIRHPMPYGNLAEQAVQRYATLDDLKKFHCTIEEMEEYEPHIAAGNVIYSGVDYQAILDQAEQEADLILWDGGNNDPSFFASDLTLTVADPLRPGHELLYWAGETNLTLADAVIINKCDSAKAEDIETVKRNIRSRNPQASIITADSRLSLEDPEQVKGKRVLVIEDGPTLTHGEMNIGAGVVASQRHHAAEIVDPRPYAQGSIAEAYRKYPRLGDVVPALGYYDEQLRELEKTIAIADCDTVVIGTPIDLRRVIKIDKPAVRVRYELAEHDPEILTELVQKTVRRRGAAFAR
ncbi:MAG TPA: cyclic 2,3-diphosphoglycerate synthase [Acidobacteriota bacterium]|nr:cyclic 2,3-diphosphoglycerate synthase [Acidobacteriota bacterium]